MAEIQLKAKILPRSDTEANWSSVNPSILPQELIYITDKNDFKINGTGAATNFSSLQYLFESKLLGLLTEAEANTKYLQLAGGNITGNLDVDGSLTVGTLSGLLKATNGVVAAAVAGTDYPNPAIYTDTKIDFVTSGLSGTIPEEQLILCGAGYHEMFGSSVGLHGGNSLVRAGYNGNNYVELSGNGTNWVMIGPSTVYPTLSTMTLGNAANPWGEIYTKKICTNSTDGLGIAFTNISSSPIFKFTTNGFEPGGAYNLGKSDNPWQSVYVKNTNYLESTSGHTVQVGSSSQVYQNQYGIKINSTSFPSGSTSSGALYLVTSRGTGQTDVGPWIGAAFNNNIMFSNTSNSIRFTCNGTPGNFAFSMNFYSKNSNNIFAFIPCQTSKTNFPQSYARLGDTNNTWDTIYLGKMQLNYNIGEECIEFLAE